MDFDLSFAGSGTTANTLAFLFYAVAKDRAIYDKLKKELQENLADWSTDATATLTISQLQNLSYTNAIIFEALRRYPTIPGTMPRRTTSSGITLDGYHIPRNVCRPLAIAVSDDFPPSEIYATDP